MLGLIILFLIFLLEVFPTSIFAQWARLERNPPLITEMIPQHIWAQKIIPYLTQKDLLNFQLSLIKKLSAVLRIRNSRKRFRLLKKYLKHYDPSNQQNYLLRFAAAKGMFDVVEILLQYPGVDPTAKKNWALILARENKHMRVYNLLADFHQDLELGLGLGEDGNSQSLLMDILDSGANTSVGIEQDIIDLKLLLKTSTQLLPDLKQGIIHALQIKRNDLAKIMFYFVSFDYSYFNHMVYFRQLAAGNSIWNLRKVDPFDDPNVPVIILAVRSNNLEMVKFILDKALKWNPFTIISCRYWMKRLRILDRAYRRLIQTDLGNEERALLLNRLNQIIQNQIMFQNLLIVNCILAFPYGLFIYRFIQYS